jgi:hypothetical protein
MAKSPEEAEKGSENNKNTSTQKTTGSEDPWQGQNLGN